jgi:F-type H+-transporting ATPase subunit epsilon
VLANRGEAKTVEQAQEQLTQAVAQLQALERLRRNLQH